MVARIPGSSTRTIGNREPPRRRCRGRVRLGTLADVPSHADIQAARRLAHEIVYRTEGTKADERVAIKQMALLIERLLSGDATADDRSQAAQLCLN